MSPLKLGLDLRGGVYLVYQVDVQGAVKQLLDHYEQDFRASLRNAHVPYQDVEVDYPMNRVRVLFRDADSFAKGKAAILADSRNVNLTEATVNGAPALELTLTPQQIKERQDYAVQQNIVILRNRLNSPELAVSEPQVAREGVDRIAIQLPGLQNSAEVKKILGKTATLEFRMVDETNNPLEAAATGHVPLGSKLYYTRDKQPVLLKRDVVVTGDQLTDASFQPNTQDGPAVSVSLDSRGAAKMLRNTEENIGHLMAVVFIDRSREKNAQGVDVDRTTEEVINRATIRGVFSNNFQITGVNPIEGRELALLLRAGGLAAPLTAVEERAIGPSLGQDNIDKGIHAMVFGMLAAFVFMAIYYKLFGLIADVVLIANVVLLTAFLSLVGAALTLPGIAAVVLTVGMAVDANILIYERIREELRNGVSPRAAITAGFDRAFSAICDSNVTALIAGLVLWLVRRGCGTRLRRGAGARNCDIDVHIADGQPRVGADHLRRKAQGRTPVDLRARSDVDPRFKPMEFFHKVTRFPFMNTRKVWYGLSAVLIVASFALVAVRGLNLGIDFTGGVVVETNFPQAPNIEQLRAALAKAGMPAAQVQAFGSSRDILVRLPPDPDVKSEQIGARILEVFKTVDGGVKLQRTEVRRSSGGPGVVRQGRLGAGGDAGAHLDLRAVALHAEARARRDIRRAARPDLRGRLFRPDPDDFRSHGDLGDPRGDRLFAERHGHRIRPHPRASAHARASSPSLR